MVNPLLKFTLPYPQTIPCCPARVSILRKILATAVIHPGRQIVLVCPDFTWYSPLFRDAGGKTRRQSMLLWADSITDVVSLDHCWSWSGWLMIRLWSLMLCHQIISDHLSHFLTCNDLFWSKIDSPLCQGHLECIVCQVKCYFVWNTLITFDQLQNILFVIFDRDEEDGQENPGILWSVLLLGLKFSVWDTSGPLGCVKNPKKPNGC